MSTESPPPANGAAPAPAPAAVGAAGAAGAKPRPDGSENWQAHVRRFAEDRVAPLAEAMDRAAHLDESLLRALFAAKLMSVQIPKRYGGAGRTFTDAVVTIEEVARVCPGVAVAVDVHNILVAGSVLRHGDGDQRRRYLPRLAGAAVGAFAISEEQAGSDAFALTTTAEPDGAGFRLVGTKRWTSNALAAGLFLVFARTGEAGERGISAFLVERDAPGLTVGEPSGQLGVRAASTCDVILDGVPVRPAHVLGGVGRGELVAVDGLALGRVGIAAQLVGLATGALEHATRYVHGRRQFGRVIAEYQGVAFPLAASAAEAEAARALTYQAARAIEACAPTHEILRLSAMAKYVASQVAQLAATRAVDAFGGKGLLPGSGVEKLYRDVKAGTIYEGTSNVLLQLIGKTMAPAPAPVPAAVVEDGGAP